MRVDRRRASVPAALRDGDSGELGRGAHLVGLHLDHGALVAFPGLERALHEAAVHDQAVSLAGGLGEVFRGIAPQSAAQKQRVAVAPFAGLPVECARIRCDGEVRDRGSGLGESQLGVGREVPDDGGDDLSGHTDRCPFLASF
ncbi:hypothetical protein Ae706Ps2_6579c [Pseudonocardia sp. Ae706_Ps2]|nr:hypothetical protein Ae706Ps2_6579c [Pseudonocardia sp. Ae706_Ps2]